MQEVKDKIVNAIASNRDEILEFTKALVAIPTENPPGRAYQTCIRVIENKLNEIGLGCTLFKVPDVRGLNTESVDYDSISYPRYCLMSYHGFGEETLYFHGHYDVVPASAPAQFSPYVKEGKIFGRGSSDMKGGLAAMIYAVKAIKESKIVLKGKVGLTIVPDEETGGVLGSQYLTDIGLLGKGGIGMLTPEPSCGKIWNANRGAITMAVTVKGEPAHVALHYQGRNAFEQMLTVANALLKLKTRLELRKTRFKIEPEIAKHSIILIGGLCEGGTNFNVVPAQCMFTIDRRINPEENLETEKQRLLMLLEKLRQKGIELEVKILQEGTSSSFSENNRIAQVLANSVKAISTELPSFEMCSGLLETRFYAKLGIPAFAYGPGLLSVSHSPHEFVEIENIYKCAVVYGLTAIRLLA